MVDHFFRDGGVSVALVLALCLLLQFKQKVRIHHVVGLCLFTLCMSLVFQITGLSPMSGWPPDAITETDYNLVPFVGIWEILDSSFRYSDPIYAVSNLLGNVALFIPLGFFVPLLWKRYRKLWKTALFGLAVSLCVELVQLLVGRGTDVDDLILNTIGAVVGYALFRLARKLARPFLKRFVLSKSKVATPWRFFPYVCVIVPLLTTFLFGFVDRASYGLLPTSANAEQAQQSAADPTPTPALTPNAGQLGEPVGTLEIADTSALTVMSQLEIPPMTATPSEADQKAIAALFNGKQLYDTIAACDSDLVIQAGDVTLVVHTACGSVAVSAGNYDGTSQMSGSTQLSSQELTTLGEILARYELSMDQEE